MKRSENNVDAVYQSSLFVVYNCVGFEPLTKAD